MIILKFEGETIPSVVQQMYSFIDELQNGQRQGELSLEPTTEPMQVEVPEVEAAPEPANAEEQPSKDDVRAALSDYARKHGAPKLKELFARFSVENLNALQESDYAAIIQVAQQ
jgi:hypothetical protein